MKNRMLIKTISFVTAFALIASVTYELPASLVSSDRTGIQAEQLTERAPQASVVYADTAAYAAEQLRSAVAERNSEKTVLWCDRLEDKIGEELEELDTPAYTGGNAELLRRCEEHAEEVRANAGQAGELIDKARSGAASDSDMAQLGELITGRTASHRSNATANIAAENKAPEEGGAVQAESPALPSDPPTDEELAFASDTDIPDSVKNMAKDLGSANEIYKFVRNSIRYESYAGSKKGAMVTLEQLGGNDIDQACLLIAMLRAQGIPARYVSGTIAITTAQAVAMTGAADTESAGRLLSARYKDVKSVTEKGKITGYTMDQTWVEAYIPYTDYRGAGNAAGDSVWVPFDASFKELSVETFEVDNEYTNAQNAVFDDLSGLSGKYPGLYSEGYEKPSKTVMHSRNIIEVSDEYLPLSLPYEVVSVDKRYSVLPDEMKDTLTIEIEGEKLLDCCLPDLYFKQINVSYVPASDLDKEAIDYYDDITKVPAYIAKVVPVVTITDDKGSTETKGSNAVALGELQQMMTTITNNGGSTILSDDIYGGSVYAIALNYQRIMTEDADLAQLRAKQAEEKAADAKNTATPEILGTYLDYVGKYYFCLCDKNAAVYSQIYNIDRNRQLGLAITGYEFRTDSSLGTSKQLSTGSFFIDAAYNSYSAVSFDGNAENEINFNTALAASESYNEQNVWELLSGNELSGVSTLSVFEQARKEGVLIPYIFDGNVEEQLAECEVSDFVKDEVRDHAAQGCVVRLVSKNIQIGDWYGTAYTVTDLRTGSCSYMLADGTAGGSTDRFEVLYNINMLLFKLNLAAAAVSLAAATVKIHCPSAVAMLGGAKQAIDAGQAIGRAFQIYYDTAFAIVECNTPEGLAAFEKKTMQNLKETQKYLKDMLKGAIEDIKGGFLDIMNNDNLGIELLANGAADAAFAGVDVAVGGDDWFNELEANPWDVVLLRLMSMLGRNVH